MFDVSFGELLVIGAVALVVIGPERLPKVARTAGMLVGRARRFVANVKADMEQELHNAELAQLQQELAQEAPQLQQEVEQVIRPEPMAVARKEESPAEAAPEHTDPAPTTPPHVEEEIMPILDDRQLDLFASLPPPAPEAHWHDRK